MIRKKSAQSRTRKPSKTRGAPRPMRSPEGGPRRAAPKAKPKPRRERDAEPTAEPKLPAAAPELSSKRRRELRADAHGLDPIVHVGHGGVSDAVVQAVSRALFDHELIKVRLHEPEDKHAMAEELARATRSGLCGLVGHTVILFRPKPKQKSVSGVARTAIKRNREKRGRP